MLILKTGGTKSPELDELILLWATYFALEECVVAGAPALLEALGTLAEPFLTAGALTPPTDMPARAAAC